MKKYLGEFVMGTAILHTVVGILLGWSQLVGIASDGFFNVIDPYFDRAAIFWFLSYGLLLFVIGLMVKWAQKEIGWLPRWLAWLFLGMGITSVILMPISGFWLLFPIAWMAYASGQDPVTAAAHSG
ncbi:MAG: DUF6463 family protein [Chloroflexota bacterium]